MLNHYFLLTLAILGHVPNCTAGAAQSGFVEAGRSSDALGGQEQLESLRDQISQLLAQLDKTELLWVHQILAQQGVGYDLHANMQRLTVSDIKDEIAAFLQEGRVEATLQEALERAHAGIEAMALKAEIEPYIDQLGREALFAMYCVMWQWNNLTVAHHDDATWRRLVRELLAGRNSNQELQRVLAIAKGA